MKSIYKILRSTLWTLLLAYLAIYSALRLGVVQSFLAQCATDALGDFLHTEVRVGRIDFRPLNRITIDDALVKDRQHRNMLRVGRLSATVDLWTILTTGRISITAIQLFGADVKLVQKTPDSPLNCQFALDALSSKDTTSTSTTDLKISSLIIRGSSVSYDLQSVPADNERFDTNHLSVKNISAKIQVNHITDTTADVSVKHLSAIEHSGVRLTNLSANAVYRPGSFTVSGVQLLMPDTHVAIPECSASYRPGKDGKPVRGSLHYAVRLQAMRVNPRDVQPFLPGVDLSQVSPVSIHLKAHGTDQSSKADIKVTSLARQQDIALQASATVHDMLGNPYADLQIKRFSVAATLVARLAAPLHLPDILTRLGNINAKANVAMASPVDIRATMEASASSVGTVSTRLHWTGRRVKMHVETDRTQIDRLLDKQPIGTLDATLDIDATLKKAPRHGDIKTAADLFQGITGVESASAKGTVRQLEYNNYTYTGVSLAANYTPLAATARLTVDDPAVRLSADGTYRRTGGKYHNATLALNVGHIAPTALHLASPHAGDTFSGTLHAQGQWSGIDDVCGTVRLSDVTIDNPSKENARSTLGSLIATSAITDDGEKEVTLSSDVLDARISGQFRLSTLPTSLANIAARRLSTLPGIPTFRETTDNFTLSANVKDLTFVQRLVELPVALPDGMQLDGFVNARTNTASLRLNADTIRALGMGWARTDMDINCPGDTLLLTLNTHMMEKAGKSTAFAVSTAVTDNFLTTRFRWDNRRANAFNGDVTLHTRFARNAAGQHVTTLSIPQSQFVVGDSIWGVRLDEAQHAGQQLSINNFHVGSSSQSMHVGGLVSQSPADSISASLRNIDVSYLLNLINFHTVSFDGAVSGSVVARGLLNDLQARADIIVDGFRFDSGRMGTLFAKADYSRADGLINIDAHAEDEAPYGSLGIKGHIQPSPGAIDLQLDADSTRLEFMQKYCGGFMHDIALSGQGRVRLHGPFSAILLTGSMTARGGFTLTSTGCHYTMPGDTVLFTTDHILFKNATIADKLGGTANVSGGIAHSHLGRMTYDISLATRKLLAYDQPTLHGDETFGGYVIMDGNVNVNGRGNMLNISAEATTLPESYIIYDATSTVSAQNASFITWGSKTHSDPTQTPSASSAPEHIGDDNDHTNIRMNFLVNATPEAKIHLITDHDTGDCIDLYGTGTLRVDYYNKGSLAIYGNYLADHGTYKMTIQNVIRRDFQFAKDGLITFSGDPYRAALGLQAKYTINSVSLSDLGLGSSFKVNNVPVNCLMNIGGTAEQPRLDFALDLPSLSSDARQMVYSVINSEEEMNQQVLYLLAVGRFYSKNDYEQEASSQRMGQGSLAMQSFVSGTLSQQFNNMMGKVIGNNKWSFGANVAPGSEGYNNAEYEGTLSGRLFDSRLIFSGQFGYRDNVNTNTSNFIGDFNLSYLLTRNGSIALKVYNQANDRYFTRSSLNTQGIGIMFQREFGK